MTPSLRIEPVDGSKALKQFVLVPVDLYRHDPHWVRPLTLERLQHLSPKHNRMFEHAEVRMWTALRGDKAVGRISAQVDQLVQQHVKKGLGHFGMFECEDNPETAKALFTTAETWLQEKGMQEVSGPFDLSVNEQVGILVDGFDTPPMVMMGHALPYYQALLEANGYGKEKDVYAYILDITNRFPEKIQRIYQAARKSKRIRMRNLDMKNYTQDIELIMDIFNDAWSENWGFVPFTPAEARQTAKALKPVVRTDGVFICEYDGVPAAMFVTVADLNELIRDMNGSLFPFKWMTLLYNLHRVHETRFRVPLMGTRKHLQGTTAGALMSFIMIEEARRNGVYHGIKWSELSWILEDNKPMINILEQIHCKRYKTYRIYGKKLAA